LRTAWLARQRLPSKSAVIATSCSPSPRARPTSVPSRPGVVSIAPTSRQSGAASTAFTTSAPMRPRAPATTTGIGLPSAAAVGAEVVVMAETEKRKALMPAAQPVQPSLWAAAADPARIRTA
jgi:hypothetical protein